MQNDVTRGAKIYFSVSLIFVDRMVVIFSTVFLQKED